MKNMNGRINPARKGKTIASVALTLAATVIMTMVPMSQAQAYRIERFGGDNRASCGANTKVCGVIFKVMGGGRTPQAAVADAKAGAVCENGMISSKKDWGVAARWFWDPKAKRYTWFSADIDMICILKRPGLSPVYLPSSEPPVWVNMVELKK